MILPIANMFPLPNRTHQFSPETFGNDCESWRSTYTADQPGTPQVLLIEQAPRTTLLPHYHASDQFQIFIEGDGKLGKHDVRPVSVHYTNSYTSYGPIIAGEQGVQYYVLRPSFDKLGFGQYLHDPVKRENLKLHTHPKRVEMADVAVRAKTELACVREISVTPCFGVAEGDTDAGLFAGVLQLGPQMAFNGADPHSGGGQILLVLQGSFVYNGADFGLRSGLAVTADEDAVSFSAGSEGLQALLMQYPKRAAA